MGILQTLKDIFKIDHKHNKVGCDNIADTKSAPHEYAKTISFNKAFENLLSHDKFIARSDYKNLIDTYQGVFDFYETLISSDLQKEYVKKHNLDKQQINLFYNTFKDIKDIVCGSSIIKKHNDEYVARYLKLEKEYLDNVLKECDSAISLDKEQREVVLSDEDHTLVIAGAGAGKTTTVAAKVRYLVERCDIDPKQILVISFTNKAVGELRERINENLNIACPITTFHSAGYDIMRKGDNQGRRIVDGGYIYVIINDYLKSRVLNNPQLVQKLILFFGSYFSAPYEGENINEYFNFVAKADFSTLRSNLHEYAKQIIDRKERKTQTLNNETLRSLEEVRIANFLYINQIDYEYEPIYKYRILDANKPYTPDFKITQGDKVSYIEHFGITEDGRNNRYSQTELDKYKSRVNKKVLLHRQHKTDLIYTFSQYNDRRDYLEHLREQLIQHGYVLKERDVKEVYKKLIDSEENKYITKLTLLVCNFISNFKTQGYKTSKFDEFKTSVKNVRTQIFLDICNVCYLEYQKTLKENHCIDFQDMINESAELIRTKQINKEQLDFKYIIVDEYQDISRQRYNLIRELSKLCHAKIIAVGDDWQSIYAFSGSVLPLFTRFSQEVGYAQELKITRTYRNAQEIIDIAGTFIQKNSSQIKKELISPKRITNPVIIHTYCEDKVKGEHGGKFYKLGQAVNKAIQQIVEFNNQETTNKVASILLIGRYGFDAKHLCYSQAFNYDANSSKVFSTQFGSQVKLQFLTAHSSKGLSAENVIIINAKDEIYGFPSQIDDDSVLNLVVTNDQSYNYAEERRLFYVALTRTKNRVLIITPERRPSDFIKELLSDTKSYPNVTLVGDLKTYTTSTKIQNTCPICGYPMQLRWNKNYGLKLWICTNDQELCGFMTNDRRGGELCIHKCDWCEDGYLVVKTSKNGYFLGCTNYKEDKSGCGRILNKDHYMAWEKNDFGIEDTTVDKPSYFIKPVEEGNTLPSQMKQEEKPAKHTVEKDKYINFTDYKEQYIEKDGFMVVADHNGNIITDMILLAELRALRYNIAKGENIAAFKIFHNQELVRLATDKPTTKEEFIAIRNLGEKKYELYGNIFIGEIKRYMQRKIEEE